MSLMQTILAEIEQEATAKTAAALASADLIREAEALHEALRAAGCDTPPQFMGDHATNARVIFYHYPHHGDLRAALAQADIVIEAERQQTSAIDGETVTILTLTDLRCRIWLCGQQPATEPAAPVALAA